MSCSFWKNKHSLWKFTFDLKSLHSFGNSYIQCGKIHIAFDEIDIHFAKDTFNMKSTYSLTKVTFNLEKVTFNLKSPHSLVKSYIQFGKVILNLKNSHSLWKVTFNLKSPHWLTFYLEKSNFEFGKSLVLL